MPNDEIRRKAIALYDRFTHEGLDRRVFMRRMVALAGSVAAAEALIGAIAASPAAAAIVPEDDRRIRTGTTSLLGIGDHPAYSAYVAEPRSRRARSTVLVIHENRGLNGHIRDVARRLALAGHYAVAPDFLSPSGGTPDDQDRAREMIGELDLGRATAAGVAMLDSLEDRQGGNGKVGAVGFCWGGAYVNRLAVAARDKLDAGVVFYGPAPGPAEASKVQASLQVHLAEEDERVNRTGFPWITALREAGKAVTFFYYEGVNHAFHNDTSEQRYDRAAAELAWQRTLRFFDRHLRG